MGEMEAMGAGRDRRLVGGGSREEMIAIELEDGAVVKRQALIEAPWENRLEEEIWMGVGQDDMDMDGTLWSITVVLKLECVVLSSGERRQP